MAESDNRLLGESSNTINMLRSLTRAANHSFAYKSLLQNVKPALYTLLKYNIHATPVAFYNQKLAKHPVPDLQKTLEKYLRSIMPMASEDELQKTKCLVEEFGKKGGCGEKLQQLLHDRAKTMDNWLEEWWLNTAYLGFRYPVVVHSSPGLVFPLKNFCRPEDRIDYAARLIISSMQYKELIDKEKIPIEKSGKDELDMQQYKKFFGTCRIPKPNIDGQEFNPTSTYIIVACNNHFYKMHVVDSCGNIISYKQVKCQLMDILDQSCEEAPAVGILSSDHRDCWANTYKLLTADRDNRECARTIHKSLYLVCLDKAPQEKCGQNRLTLAGHQTIHGGGIDCNSGNRWFDKTVQFIIGEDGIVGMTYEHSPAEGQPIALMTDYIINNMGKVSKCGPEVELPCVERLDFQVGCELEKAIKCSADTLENLINDFDLQVTVFNEYGKNFIKKEKMSPDSFFQMGMQYSYYRLYCKPAAQYEAGATRKFKGGRTDTIRSCSVESVKFAQAMLDDKVSAMDKRHMLQAAINSHKNYTLDAVNGMGIDRHFLGMELVAKEYCIDLPELFCDPTFLRSKRWVISTSQVSPKCEGVMVFGAVVPNGYGICYNPRDDNMLWACSCFNSDNSTSAKEMNKALIASFKDMYQILCKSQKSKI